MSQNDDLKIFSPNFTIVKLKYNFILEHLCHYKVKVKLVLILYSLV